MSTTKLAEALRRLINASMVAMTDQELATGETLSAWEDANEALAAHEAAKPAEHAIVAGALFDFLGFLTTSKRRWTFSGSDEAGPAVEALEQWAAKRGLHLDEAIVEGWMEKLRAAPVAVASPLSDEQIEAMPVWKHFVGLMPEHRLEFTRAIEAAHGIKEMKP